MKPSSGGDDFLCFSEVPTSHNQSVHPPARTVLGWFFSLLFFLHARVTTKSPPTETAGFYLQLGLAGLGAGRIALCVSYRFLPRSLTLWQETINQKSNCIRASSASTPVCRASTLSPRCLCVLLIFKELLSGLVLFILLLEYSVPSVLVPWTDCSATSLPMQGMKPSQLVACLWEAGQSEGQGQSRLFSWQHPDNAGFGWSGRAERPSCWCLVRDFRRCEPESGALVSGLPTGWVWSLCFCRISFSFSHLTVSMSFYFTSQNTHLITPLKVSK